MPEALVLWFCPDEPCPGLRLHSGLEKCRESLPLFLFLREDGGRELSSIGFVCPPSSVFVKVTEI